MAENIEYLMLEQFRAMRNKIEGLQTEMRSEFSDVKHRINRLESMVLVSVHSKKEAAYPSCTSDRD